jgi:putative metalloprotease
MKKLLFPLALLCLSYSSVNAQIIRKINLSKVTSAASKGAKAATLSDAEVAQLSVEAVKWMDENNPVCGPKDKYTVRLNKIFAKHKNEDGFNLNYKVYNVKDVNAMAFADGSVRVCRGLMDYMTDDEVRSVVGHEIGHVANRDIRDAMRAAYKRAALSDAIASTGDVASSLTQGQLGQLAEGMLNAKFSRKQETQADEYGYRLMKKHNYNVMAQVSAFRKLEKLNAGAQQPESMTAKMLSSHPDSGQRAEHIINLAKADGLYVEESSSPAGNSTNSKKKRKVG